MNDDRPSGLREFFTGLEQYPVFSTKEEKKWIKRAQEGDEDARDRVICSNVRLVISQVLKFVPEYDSRAPDLAIAGVFGLMRALDRFDISRNYKFSTYAVWWIRQAIQNERRFFDEEIGRVQSLSVQFEEAAARVEDEDGKIDPIKMADALGWTKTKVERFLPKRKTARTLRTKGTKTGNGIVEPTHKDVFKKEVDEKLYDAIFSLKPLETYLVIHRAGLCGERPKTYTELEEFLGKCKERLRQIENGAHLKIYMKLRNALLDIDWTHDA